MTSPTDRDGGPALRSDVQAVMGEVKHTPGMVERLEALAGHIECGQDQDIAHDQPFGGRISISNLSALTPLKAARLITSMGEEIAQLAKDNNSLRKSSSEDASQLEEANKLLKRSRFFLTDTKSSNEFDDQIAAFLNPDSKEGE